MMADEKRDDTGEIFKVETIPPPAGDNDAYSAPTRVGPVSAEAWVELIKQADADGRKQNEADKLLGDSAPHSSKPRSSPQPISKPGANTAPPSSQTRPAEPEVVPKLWEDDAEEDGNQATMLNPNAVNLIEDAKPPPVPPAAVAPAPPPPAAPAAMAAPAPPPQQMSAPLGGLGAPAAQMQLQQPAPQPGITSAQPSSRLRYLVTIALCVAVFAVGLGYYYYAKMH